MTISSLQSTESELWETANGEYASSPETAVVSATVSAPSGVTIGPFDGDTLDSGNIESILLAVEAAGVLDNGVYADTPSSLPLHDRLTG